MNCIVALFALVAVTMAATTHKPHGHHTHDPNHTKEPSEHEGFAFYYVPTTNNLVIHSGKDCYVAILTPDELTHVHTDSGLRSVELRLLNQLSTATVTTNSTLNAADVKHCTHRAVNFYTIN